MEVNLGDRACVVGRRLWRPIGTRGLALARATALVAALAVLPAAPTAASPPAQGGYSPSFEVTGAVARPRRYALADLQRLPAIDVASRCIVEGTSRLADHGYRGVSLWTLVSDAGLAIPGPEFQTSLRGYIVATDPLGFPAIVPLVEIDPAFNRREVIVAYERDGELLDESLGMAQLVVPGDTTCARNVYWLARLEVRYVEPPGAAGH